MSGAPKEDIFGALLIKKGNIIDNNSRFLVLKDEILYSTVVWYFSETTVRKSQKQVCIDQRHKTSLTSSMCSWITEFNPNRLKMLPVLGGMRDHSATIKLSKISSVKKRSACP